MEHSIDREKVIEWADKCTSPVHESEDCNGCPYHLNHEGFYSCIECLLMDTIALLKEERKPDCEHAEYDGIGCLGYAGCTQDDEPIEACKQCEKYTGNICSEY